MFADSVPNFCQCNNYIQGKSVTCCRTSMGRRQCPWRGRERIPIRVKSASTDETNMACEWQVNVSSIWFNQEVKGIHSVFLNLIFKFTWKQGHVFVSETQCSVMNILWVLDVTTKWLSSGGLEAKEAFVYQTPWKYFFSVWNTFIQILKPEF